MPTLKTNLLLLKIVYFFFAADFLAGAGFATGSGEAGAAIYSGLLKKRYRYAATAAPNSGPTK